MVELYLELRHVRRIAIGKDLRSEPGRKRPEGYLEPTCQPDGGGLRRHLVNGLVQVGPRLLEARIVRKGLKDQFDYGAKTGGLGDANGDHPFGAGVALELCVQPPDQVRFTGT